jgi:outer membrane protein OmpA-like peptidoglycan-associated protein
MRKALIIVVIGLFVVGSLGCSGMSKKEKGAIAGATAGAVVGGIIGNQAGNTAVGAILGAAIGGAAGAYIGNYMDKQAEEMRRDLEGAKIERIGEGIKITFDSGILFDINSSSLRPEAQMNLTELAQILKKYDKTNILIEGHTDATGPEEYNLQLSINRAQSVANHLNAQQVNPTRFNIMGYGETQPIATNETTDGRQMNRRVDIAIFANDKLKSVAEEEVG